MYWLAPRRSVGTNIAVFGGMYTKREIGNMMSSSGRRYLCVPLPAQIYEELKATAALSRVSASDHMMILAGILDPSSLEPSAAPPPFRRGETLACRPFTNGTHVYYRDGVHCTRKGYVYRYHGRGGRTIYEIRTMPGSFLEAWVPGGLEKNYHSLIYNKHGRHIETYRNGADLIITPEFIGSKNV